MRERNAPAMTLRTICSLAASLAVGGSQLAAQTPDDAAFDEDRVFIAEKTIFVPFRVVDEDIRPLREALEEGLLQSDTWLLIMEHGAGRLAMVMDQMASHHVAQGTLRGEPWMVSF